MIKYGLQIQMSPHSDHHVLQITELIRLLFLLSLEYEVVVVTGSVKGAGTDANVSLTIFGKTGQTPKLALKSNSRNAFERNQSDIFVLKTVCCGPLTKVRFVPTAT